MRRFSIVTALAAAFALAALANVADAHPPWGIAADGRGLVYFSALETVWKIDESGRLSIFRPGVSGRHTHELTLDEGGNLYGEDVTYEPAGERWVTAVWKATPSGEVSFLLAPTDSPPRGASIWRDRDGSTYSVQSDNPAHELLLLKRDPAGRVSLLLGGKTSFERGRQVILYNVAGTAFGPDGALYFTDGADIFKAARDGTVRTHARGVAGAASTNRLKAGHVHRGGLLGLAVDARGFVYAADIGNRRVLKVTPDGAASAVYTSEANWEPTGVACAGESVYVLEFGTTPSGINTPPRVLKLAPGARASVLASVADGVEGGRRDSRPVASSSTNDGGSHTNVVNYESPARRGRGRGVVYALMCATLITLALVAFAVIRKTRSRLR